MNATAVIDKQGIEGEVIKKTAPIALLMVIVVSVITLCWSLEYVWWQWIITILIGIAVIAALILGAIGFRKLKEKLKAKRKLAKSLDNEEEP
ncbi:MAG: hypothetical protein ACTSSH_13690 [Candidatus Heimdallarchaeota archaeon]